MRTRHTVASAPHESPSVGNGSLTDAHHRRAHPYSAVARAQAASARGHVARQGSGARPHDPDHGRPARAARRDGPRGGVAGGLVNYPSPDVMGFTDATNAFAVKYAQADRERMKLVEVVTPARALGKEPVVVQDSPAFASSRLGRGFTAGGSACLPSADRGLPSLRSPPSRCAMGTSPVIVRPQPVRRRLPDAPSARDAELAEAIRRGDERALDRLLAHRWAPLVSYVAGRVGDVELAKDIAQEAFVRLWERRHKIDPSRSVVAYLYQVARRRAIDELRREDVRARWAEREHYQVLEARAA